MIHCISNPDTGEVITFTEDQIRMMIEHSPEGDDKSFLEGRVLKENLIELDHNQFYYIMYLAARTWLGIKRNGYSS